MTNLHNEMLAALKIADAVFGAEVFAQVAKPETAGATADAKIEAAVVVRTTLLKAQFKA